MRTRQLPLFVGLIMLSLMLVGVVSASYPMFHYDAQRTGYVTQDGPQTNATLWVAETAEYADGSPAVHNGKVFVPTWPDMDFVDNDPMGLVCYDAATGTELWTNELGGTSIGSVSGVAVADGQVYLGGTDGRLYCIDEEAGETLWTSGQIDATGYFGLSSSPLVYEGTVYALSASGGVLHAFTPEGTGSWSFSTGGTASHFTSPAAAGGKIFVAGGGNNLFCIDAATHTAAWSAALPAAVKSTPVIGDGKVYATTVERLYALDASTGAEVWNASLGGTSSTPAVAGETVIAGSSDGLHAYDAGTGILLWDFPGAQVGVSPVVAGNLVYAATNERTGTVYAVDTRTGEEVWSYTLEAPGDGTFAAFYASSPAVSDGVLYIGAENNRLYAFGDGGLPEPAFTGWNGTVMLTAGRTFTVTPFNNESATYTIDRTSALGALDAAAAKGGFDYTVQETTFGPFLYSIGGIAYDEATWDSWLYAVNGVPADVGAADYRLAEGDVVTYWYGAWGSNPETAHAAVTITVSIPASPEPTPTLWSGTVALTKGETFSFVPSNNASASYTINRTTDLGALAFAAQAGNFTFSASDAWYASFGSFLLEDIAGIANEDWTQENARSWSIFINGAAAPAGLGANTLADGDRLVFYYCPSDPVTYAPLIDRADHTIIIDIAIRDFAWEGPISLAAGRTFTVTPFNNENTTYTIDRTSALGALDAAAAKGGFDYTVQETTFGPFLYSIGDIAYDEVTWNSWLYAVNGVPADVGAADYRLADGDVVTYWYGAWGSNPETAHAAVTITVAIPAPESGGGGDGGGDSSPSWITVTLEPGTFTLTADNSKKTYDVNRQTALGALDAAGIGYTVDDSYYQQYESLFIDSIRGRKNEGTKGWMYQVNGESPGSGANTHTVGDGDKVVFFWSESMSSTPATSPDVISIKVAIQVSPGSLDPDSSDGEGSGATPSSTGEQPNNGETGSLSFSLGLPVGVTVDLGEWGQAFSVNTTGTTAAGETVVVSGNTLTIDRSGLVLTVAAKNIDEKEGVARGLIESVTAAINPIAREIEGLGTITASLILNLTGIPAADGRLDVAFNATPDAAAGNAFALAAAENGKEITALAYTMTVTRTNLENGEDIAGAVIRMTISPGWVEEHGGADAIRIARSAEDGTYQVLETRVVGIDESGNLIVEAVSPGGLSTFGLLAVRAAQDTHATAATSAAPGASSAAGTPAEASPLIISAIGAIPVIGTAYLIARRRREQ